MQLVIGLGSGRCGTTSLAHLLNKQPHASVTHEEPPLLPWQVDAALLAERLAGLRARPETLVGDVAFYYLPYVELIAAQLPNTRFVCLRRDREETVRSFVAKSEGVHHWIQHDGTQWQKSPDWDDCFPKYDLVDKTAAIGRYWDEYYARATELATQLPSFRIFEMTALNDREGVEDLLDFIGVKQRALVVGTRRNRGSGVGKFMYDALSRATYWLGLNPRHPHAQHRS